MQINIDELAELKVYIYIHIYTYIIIYSYIYYIHERAPPQNPNKSSIHVPSACVWLCRYYSFHFLEEKKAMQ